MKNLFKSFTLIICLFIGGHIVGQQLGSWVISTTPFFNPSQPFQPQNTDLFELTFSTSGITGTFLSNTSEVALTELSKSSTSSGYLPDQSLACYTFSNSNSVSFYNSNKQFKQKHTWSNMDHTSCVIPRPGSTSQFCAIYTSKGTTKSDQGFMWVTLIDDSDGDLTITPHSFDNKHYQNTDFCLASELNNDRFIYYSSNDIGLNRISIEQILGNVEVGENLVPENNPILGGHFYAHEMEMKQYAEEIQVAWTTLESTGNLYMVTYDINTNTSDIEVFSPGEGIIAGVEFSQTEENIIYLSCANIGIVKYNYSTQQKINMTSSVEYNRTSLQTAPDGYIYAVKNSGDYFGRINPDPQNNVFENEVFHLPQAAVGFYGFLVNKRAFTEDVSPNPWITYHMLPKHDVLSTMVETSDVSCPGMSDGTVIIYAGGGTPAYTITCHMGNTEITGFEYNEDEYSFFKDGLSEGEYTYIITDARGTSSSGTFSIGLDMTGYDHIEQGILVETGDDPEWTDLNTSYLYGFTIKSGMELTIRNSTIKFGTPAKIIIEPGATLVLEGTTLTNHEECNLMWQGIEVQGDENYPQQPELVDLTWVYHQGRLIMQSSTIENAIEAVGLLQRDAANEIITNRSGGIVVANNSHFLNNVNSVHFIPYKNFNYNFNSTSGIDNASYFSNCTFELNARYIPDYTFYKHVDLYGVKGIEFRNCDFNLTATNGVSPYNQGIAAYESVFSVLPNCQNAIEPCPEEYILHSTFSGFYRAVASYNTNIEDGIFFTVRQALFTNNSVGIYAVSTLNAIVTNSTFEIGENPVSKANYQVSESFGIDIYSSNGFILEDNEFEKYSGAEDGHYTGIRVFACPSVSDDIYRNKYTGLSVGNLAELSNRSGYDNDGTGVAYLCNHNIGNDYDFHVAEDSKIRYHMGTELNPSGNILSDPLISDVQFQNDYTENINYYYYSGNPMEILTEFSNFVTALGTPIQNVCPTLHGTGGTSIKLTSVQKLAKETEYAEKLTDYNNVTALYNSLLDGGSTSAELSDIESATADEMWVLRNKLLGDSPHLSQEVLIAMSDRTDVFPDAILLEILSANPEELRKEELISFLEDKENPLPEYMINILLQVANGSSYKSVLQNQMTIYHHEYVNAAQDIIRSLQHDSITDFVQLRYWLDNIGGYEMDKQIISTYMKEGDYTSAQSLLDILPSIYELNGDQLLAYNDYHTMVEMQIQLAQQQRNIHQLTSTELATVTNLADNGMGSAKYSARSILEYAYDVHYFDRPSLPENIGLKTVKPLDQEEWAKALGLELSIDPNPASQWAEFTWQLPPAETTGLITITDISGKTISTINISGNQGKRVWDPRDVNSGVYICTLSVGKLVSSTKLIVK